MKIGFIGLGIMGRPMAKHMVKAGCELLVNDINREAVADLVSQGAAEAGYREIAEQADVIITMLPKGQIVKQVVTEELLPYMKEGTLVVDHSSITPTEAREIAAALETKKAAFADAPVSGGEPGAIKGSLAIMVGASEETFERALPFFDPYAASVVRIGEVGAGSVAKLANQIIVNNNIAIVAEALVFAKKAGADPEKVYQAIRGGLAGSAVLDAKAPMMIAGDFRPGGTLTINHKDITNVVQTAHQVDAPIPYSAQLYEIMQVLKIHGHLGDDHSGIVQYFEKLAGITVKE